MKQKIVVSVAIAVIMLLSPILSLSAAANQDHTSSKDRLVVSFDSADAIVKLEELAESHGSTIRYLEKTGLALWENWNSMIKTYIEKIPGVEAVEIERLVRTAFTPSDPYFSTSQWGLERINADTAWDFTLGSSSVVIAVLDTGIDYTHDDLTANMWRDSSGHYGYDFWNDDSDPMDDNVNGYEGGTWTPNMYIYHGTHVAGVAGAVTNNAIGIAGVSQSKLMAVKVMNDSGEGTDASVAEGMYYAVDNGADIIVMSLGVESTTLALRSAVNHARDHGVVLVAAAGNDGTSGIAYPAAYPEVISVGAIDRIDHRATFSNYGDGLDVMAPGTRILSTRRGDTYQELDGTSTATPFVGGVAALMLSVNPALTPAEISSVLNQTADDVSSAGYDITTGWGVVDAHNAVVAVSGPAATIIDYPEAVRPNSSVTIEWVVSGAGELPINSTYLRWGYSSDNMNHVSGLASGNTTPHTFSASNVISPPEEGDHLYLEAVAIIDGIEYRSQIVSINVSLAAGDPFEQLINSIKNFIENDIGLLNFILIIIAIGAVISVLLVVRAKKRSERARMAGSSSVIMMSPPPPQYPPYPGQPVPGYHSQEPVPEVRVEIIKNALSPALIEISEGTRVVWRNAEWAPPPGISIISGYHDDSGPHPDGIFSSGLMIAPGEYWSCIFNAPGVYQYYIGNLNINGKIIVRQRF